jgi:hypothetical protein
VHGFAVSVVGVSAAVLGHFALVFGELGLLFGLDALLLRGCVNPLVLDGIGRIGLPGSHRDESHGQAFVLEERDQVVVDLGIDAIERGGADRGFVHAAFADGLADHDLELLLDVVGVRV